MEPVFAKRENGKSHTRVPDAFWCRTDGTLGKGRTKTRFVS